LSVDGRCANVDAGLPIPASRRAGVIRHDFPDACHRPGSQGARLASWLIALSLSLPRTLMRPAAARPQTYRHRIAYNKRLSPRLFRH